MLDLLHLSSEQTFLPRLSCVHQGMLRIRQTSLPAAFRRALLAALPSLAGEGPAPSWVGLHLLLWKAGSGVFRANSHQRVLHILIKVPPWAGRTSDRWLQSEVQGCSDVKHSVPGCTGECRMPSWLTPLEAGLSFLLRKGAAGRCQSHPDAAQVGLRDRK